MYASSQVSVSRAVVDLLQLETKMAQRLYPHSGTSMVIVVL